MPAWQVTHHGAGKRVGRLDADMHDRLQQHGVRTFHAVTEGEATRNAEADFVRVHFMASCGPESMGQDGSLSGWRI